MSSEPIDCDTATGQELAGAVADYIEEHGWTTGTLFDHEGNVCLVGAIAGVCVGDPQVGYMLLQGYRAFDAPRTGVPQSIIQLATALDPVLSYRAVIGPEENEAHGYGENVVRVSDGALIIYNDHVVSGMDELIGTLRKVQNGEPVVTDA